MDNRASDDILISLATHHADNILAGAETVEVRRRAPRVSAGTRVWIYSKKPRARIDMVAVVSEIHVGPAEELWSRFGRESAISGEHFFTYLDGASRPCVIRLSSARPLREPLTLAQMRSHVRGGGQPPQFFTRLEPVGGSWSCSSHWRNGSSGLQLCC